MDKNELKATARGIGVRATILGVAGVAVGVGVVTVAAKTAEAAAKITLATVILLVGGTYLTWKTRGIRRRFTQPEPDSL
jgi:threonine/homoserine/homoserine lactone efflux protein